MKPRIEKFGDATLYLGDSREILPTLPKSDLLMTDPPYLLTSGGATMTKSKDFRNMQGFFAPGSEYANSGKPVEMCEFDEWMGLAFKALADNADSYVMANDKNQFQVQLELLKAGFRFHNLLVWDKVSATPNRFYMKNCEFAVYSWKGKARTINDCASKQLITCPQVDETDHPTEKPVPLMEHYIGNSTDRGQTVLDPFMGTGTTGVSALRAGRAFIGIELVEKYFNYACRRIEAALRSPTFDFLESGAA